MNLKLNIKKTIFVGFAFFLISMFWQVYDTVIAKILIDSFGLNQTWSGVVMALDNVIAVVLLPVFGKLSDDKQRWFFCIPFPLFYKKWNGRDHIATERRCCFKGSGLNEDSL